MQSTEKKGFSGKDAVRRLFSDYSYLVSFVLILIIAVSVNPNFFRWRNISTLFRQSATTTGMIALSMTMIICAGQIDISVGAQVALLSGFGIEVLNATHSIWIMLAFCLAAGSLIGLFNGVLVAKGHMPAMIATLAVQTSCRAIINHFGQGGPFAVANGMSTEPYYETFRQVSNGSFNILGYKIPYPMIMFIVMAMLFGLIMQRTRLGKHIYAVGSNETSARLAGVNVDGVKIAVFMISGLMCGFTSWLYSSSLMAVAAASAGNLFEMDAIASCYIGGASATGGVGTVGGAIIGALIMGVLNNGMSILGINVDWQQAIKGVVLLIAVLFDISSKNKQK